MIKFEGMSQNHLSRLELCGAGLEQKFIKLNILNNLNNSLKLVKNESKFFFNLFDKSLVNDYIMIIKGFVMPCIFYIVTIINTVFTL